MGEIERLMVAGQAMPFSHYCHVVRAREHVWISGAVGVTETGEIQEGVVAQFRLAIANMDACLRAAGGRVEDVVRVRIYLTDIADRAAINPERVRYFGENRPASTFVEVSALVDPGLRVEIEAEAFVLG